jgi:hypothetical protein
MVCKFKTTKLQMKNCNLQITMFPSLQVIKHMHVLHKIASLQVTNLNKINHKLQITNSQIKIL